MSSNQKDPENMEPEKEVISKNSAQQKSTSRSIVFSGDAEEDSVLPCDQTRRKSELPQKGFTRTGRFKDNSETKTPVTETAKPPNVTKQ